MCAEERRCPLVFTASSSAPALPARWSYAGILDAGHSVLVLEGGPTDDVPAVHGPARIRRSSAPGGNGGPTQTPQAIVYARESLPTLTVGRIAAMTGGTTVRPAVLCARQRLRRRGVARSRSCRAATRVIPGATKWSGAGGEQGARRADACDRLTEDGPQVPHRHITAAHASRSIQLSRASPEAIGTRSGSVRHDVVTPASPGVTAALRNSYGAQPSKRRTCCGRPSIGWRGDHE